MDRIDVYVEAGAKRVFAGAIAWPGWCRSARTEEDALEALVAYGPRYGKAVARRKLASRLPAARRRSGPRTCEGQRDDRLRGADDRTESGRRELR
jgi:hypothetical protein